MKIQAQMIADSISPQGHRLSTLLLTFPRFILAELNTHRILSKNSASSRAIPTPKLIEMIKINPFIPIAWQENHTGMQGIKYHTDIAARQFNQEWLIYRDHMILGAEKYHMDGATKQLANRLLEPFMWHTVLISGTEWENFFELRCPQYIIHTPNEDLLFRSRKDLLASLKNLPRVQEAVSNRTEVEWLQENKGQAEIHMMALAEAIWDAQNESIPKQLQAGQWHIPFEDKIIPSKLLDNNIGVRNSSLTGGMWEEALIKVSTAMAARTSYTVVGDEKEIGYNKLIDIHDRMAIARPFHASPFEHCAPAMSNEEHEQYVKVVLSGGKKGDRKFIRNTEYGWCRNFRGFIQYRHILESKT